jgi:cytochrome c-type biogenesis protein
MASKHFPKLLLPGVLLIGTVLLIAAVPYLSRSPLYQGIEEFAFTLGEGYERWFSQQQTDNPLLLLVLSFVGGVIASVSPCILSLLPVNLSYIGTREITSRRDAFVKAGSFVLGVVTVLSLLGLFSSFAGIVLVKFRGYFHIAVGSLIIVMGLSLAGLIRLPLPPNPGSGTVRSATSISEPWASLRGRIRLLLTGPYGVGLTFALVSSPCTSPVMFAVLAAAAATGSQMQSTLVMVCYALGYTAIIFLASLFAGLAKQTRSLLVHSQTVIHLATVLLLAVGGFYLINGIHWVVALWT